MKLLLSCLLAASASVALCQTPAATPNPTPVVSGQSRIGPGSKVFIETKGNFEIYLSAAIQTKKVPLVVVDTKEAADYVITSVSQLDAPGWAKTIFIGPYAHAGASITMKDAHTGALVFAYAVDKTNARHGEQSTAEACAKHLKQAIEKK